jgi:hypothetical protein
MPRKSILAAAACLVAMNLTGTALAGADDYVFEPVKSEIKSSNVATVAVRLLHKLTGKPVINAAIVQTRLDMRPMGWPPWLQQSLRYPAPNPASTPSRPLSQWRDGGS